MFVSREARCSYSHSVPVSNKIVPVGGGNFLMSDDDVCPEACRTQFITDFRFQTHFRNVFTLSRGTFFVFWKNVFLPFLDIF